MTFLVIVTFVVPAFIPPPAANSDSYCFGFNNHLFQALLLLTLGIAAFLTHSCRLTLPPAPDPGPCGAGGLSNRLLGLSLGGSALLCGFMCWLSAPLGGMNDSVYYLDRIHLMLRGLTPVRDFEFIYGTGPLYGSILLARWFHISANAGYFTLWVSASLLGLLLLGISIRWLELPERGKRAVFLSVFLLMITLFLCATINYTSLRYTLPLFGVAGLSRIDRNANRRWAAVLFAVAIMALLLAYSPEEGLVYSITACLFLPLRRMALQRPFVPELLALLFAAAGQLLVVAHLGTFVTMGRLSEGAFSLPAYPGPHILFAFAALLLLVSFVAADQHRALLASNVAAAAIYSLGMIPGAMGRCDTIHVAGYLLPGLLCALLILQRWSAVWRPAVVFFVVVFTVLPFVFSQWQQPPVLSKAFLYHLYRGDSTQHFPGRQIDNLTTLLATRLLGQQRGTAKMLALRNSAAAASVDPAIIFPGSTNRIQVPFQYMPNKTSNYQAPGLDEGYFMGTLNVLTPADTQRKIEGLRSHAADDLIVSTEDFDQCDPRGGNRRDLELLLLLPWVPQPRTQVTIFLPLCAYIRENYHFTASPQAATFGYGLMSPNSAR